MSLSFPKPEISRDRIYKMPDDEFRLVSIMAELLSFQADTIEALAAYLISQARKFELTHKTISHEELKSAGEMLRTLAETLAPPRSEGIVQ